MKGGAPQENLGVDRDHKQTITLMSAVYCTDVVGFLLISYSQGSQYPRILLTSNGDPLAKKMGNAMESGCLFVIYNASTPSSRNIPEIIAEEP